ncbi:hypothetical protein UA08_01260 [Talaromyces atroroseus]|uniref:Uncharacterized protein n=1 Tax=Talaromyces atroroseus TaxID=1441469 RepID=A0A1Q5QCI0_TALAT|nr:hypothetical protein UA08_01260 [Talaromyces atroroseus]OKL63579.1 hypothetical protein UA08_01260 [Talaromyces atroroseus]
MKLEIGTCWRLLLGGANLAVNTKPEPCEKVRQIGLEALNTGLNGQIPGYLAIECLSSMPFVPELAVTFVQEYRKYLQFHSTVDLLKNGINETPGTLPAIDLFGGLQNIEEKAAANKYSSQFDFDSELHGLLASANDGHLFLGLCSLGIFTFRNPVALASISTDGFELPKVYLYGDAYAASSTTVSPVLSINNVSVAQYLEQYVSNQPLQDQNAQYNLAFPSNSRGVTEEEQGVWELRHWPTDSTVTIEFENGTYIEIESFAETSHNISDSIWANGRTLFDSVCLPTTTQPASSAPSTSVSEPLGPANGYPEQAVVRDEWNRISGYFVQKDEFDDIAVLAVPTFLTGNTDDPTNETAVFAQTARDFIRTATAKGKSKLLIDMSGNGGGNLVAGLNLFRILFPGQEISNLTRFRAHDAIRLIGKIFAQTRGNRSLTESESLVIRQSGLDYHSVVKAEQRSHFSSWDELYGPDETHGMNSSRLFSRFNFTAVFPINKTVNGDRIGDADHSPNPFVAENIVVITDGFCASTCALFLELMRPLGVRSIVFGGRPQSEPMQAIGGVRGGQYWDLETIDEISQVASRLADNVLLTDYERLLVKTTLPRPLDSLPLALTSGGVNFLNAYSERDDMTPLQFVYEAADCRLFYTWDNLVSQESVWISAAEAMFNHRGCVVGSVH